MLIPHIFRPVPVLILAFLVTGVPSAFADPPEGKGYKKEYKGKPGKGPKKGGKGRDGGGDILINIGITAPEARDIALSQHLTGYRALPPGIQKNLARGKPLPPGIAKKMVPQGMLVRLPVHPGYEWRVMGSDLVLVAVATAIIADVLHDVFR